jgi:small subunit ribosomal protein S16
MLYPNNGKVFLVKTYRVVVVDSRRPRDGAYIEQIGRYDPRQEPSLIEIDNDRALDWLSKGAQPTDRAKKLLEISGAWTKFRITKGDIHTIGAPATDEKAAPGAPATSVTPGHTPEVHVVGGPVEEAAPAAETDTPVAADADAAENDAVEADAAEPDAAQPDSTGTGTPVADSADGDTTDADVAEADVPPTVDDAAPAEEAPAADPAANEYVAAADEVPIETIEEDAPGADPAEADSAEAEAADTTDEAETPEEDRT